jgi:hypothetical protein
MNFEVKIRMAVEYLADGALFSTMLQAAYPVLRSRL